jgi:membrane protein YqaA with SNARE-associated domain
VSRILLVTCLGCGLGVILCMVQYILIRLGRFRRNAFLGLPGYYKESNTKWTRAHVAAAPWILRAGVSSLVASVLAGVGLLLAPAAELSELLAVVSVVTGAVAGAFNQIGALGAAHRATRRT